MFAKHLKKSAFSAAAVGAVLAVAATTTPGTVTAAPTLKNVACESGYENKTATTTNLTLVRPIQQYGQRNRANVTVTSDAGEPTGSVIISVAGRTWTVPVTNGEATKALPRRLPAQNSYDVRARFRPDCADGTQYARSASTKVLTVRKANTRIPTRSAASIRRGERPVVRAIVESTVSPGGEARVTIVNGNAKKSKIVSVSKLGAGESLIRARFSRTRKLGVWDVTIRYIGTRNFRPSTEFTTFRVRR